MTYSKTEIASPNYRIHRDEASEDGVEEFVDQASRASSEMSTLLVHGRADANAADTMARFKGSSHPAHSPVERATYWPMTPVTTYVPLETPTDLYAAPEAGDGQCKRNSHGSPQRQRDKGKVAFNKTAELEHDITFDTDHGPVLRQSDVRAAPKAAHRKVKRHATVTDRFHQGRKRNEENDLINIAQLDQQQIDEKAAEPRCRQLEPQPRNASKRIYYIETPTEEPTLQREPSTSGNTQIGSPQVFSYETRRDSLNEALPQRSLWADETEMDADTAGTITGTTAERAHSLRHAKRLPKPQLLDSIR